MRLQNLTKQIAILFFIFRRLLQNVGPRVKAIPEDELLTAITRPARTGVNGNATGQADSNQDVDIEGVHENTDSVASTSNSAAGSSSSSSADATSSSSSSSASDKDSATEKNDHQEQHEVVSE